MLGLRTWWVDAVGTKSLSLHASIAPLAVGAVAGMATGLGSTAWTLRSLRPVTPRGLLAGVERHKSRGRWLLVGSFVTVIALALLAAALVRELDQTAGFFAAGTLLMIAAVCFESAWFSSRSFGVIRGQITLGVRSATYRRGRSLLCIALIASATFIIVSLDAFRRSDTSAGTGGFPLVAESVLPLIHDPNTAAGRDALNLPPLDGVEFVPFRLRTGDDARCLHLYPPRKPRIVAPPAAFLRTARFAFQDSAPRIANQWLLLESDPGDGVIPAMVRAHLMAYSLHLK